MKTGLRILTILGIVFLVIFIIFDGKFLESDSKEYTSAYEALIPISIIDAASLYKMISH